MFVIAKSELIKKLKKLFIYTNNLFGIFFLKSAMFADIIFAKNGSFFDQKANKRCIPINADKKYSGLTPIP